MLHNSTLFRPRTWKVQRGSYWPGSVVDGARTTPCLGSLRRSKWLAAASTCSASSCRVDRSCGGLYLIMRSVIMLRTPHQVHQLDVGRPLAWHAVEFERRQHVAPHVPCQRPSGPAIQHNHVGWRAADEQRLWGHQHAAALALGLQLDQLAVKGCAFPPGVPGKPIRSRQKRCVLAQVHGVDDARTLHLSTAFHTALYPQPGDFRLLKYSP